MTVPSGTNGGDLSVVEIGRFRLTKQVDACAAATCYIGVNGDQRVWVEVLSPDVPDVAVQRLKDQRAAMANLKRAKLPEVIEFGQEDQRAFVAFRRPDGESLASRIGRGGLGALETVQLLRLLGDALAEVHALGISHGNLSEQCIFFGTDEVDRLELLGFGLAGLSSGLEEQPDPKQDLKAAGRIAYRCLAGDEAAGEDPPQLVLGKQSHLPQGVRELVLALMDGAIDEADALTKQALALMETLTTDIEPLQARAQKDGQKIEVVLRTTIEAVGQDGEDSGPEGQVDPSHYPAPTDEPRRPEPRSPLVRRPPTSWNPIEPRTLLVAAAVILAVILGLWAIAGSGDETDDGVVVESIGE